MPLYEYKCKKCGKTFEFLCIRSSDGNCVKCPECGELDTERVMSCFSTSSGSTTKGVPGGSCSTSSPFS